MPRARQPNCYIIAGSNGAGKTTFATEFLPRYVHCDNFINPDIIASGLSPSDPNASLVRAGRMVLERIEQSSRARADLAFETTLSGRTYARLLKRLRAAGYRIHMFYLWIPSAELALARVQDRVARGGHDVPPQLVRRRFFRTLRNLLTLYRPLLDTLHCFDSSEADLHLVFKDENKKTSVFDQVRYTAIVSKVNR